MVLFVCPQGVFVRGSVFFSDRSTLLNVRVFCLADRARYHAGCSVCGLGDRRVCGLRPPGRDTRFTVDRELARYSASRGRLLRMPRPMLLLLLVMLLAMRVAAPPSAPRAATLPPVLIASVARPLPVMIHLRHVVKLLVLQEPWIHGSRYPLLRLRVEV